MELKGWRTMMKRRIKKGKIRRIIYTFIPFIRRINKRSKNRKMMMQIK